MGAIIVEKALDSLKNPPTNVNRTPFVVKLLNFLLKGIFFL